MVLPRSSSIVNDSERRSINSIAVLPFANMSPDPEQEYFCEGIAEELINGLGRIKNLRVASRTSAFQFKGTKHDIREIGERLYLSRHTVKSHAMAIYRKLSVSSRNAAVERSRELGLL